MRMTVEEAAKIWCSEVRVVQLATAGDNEAAVNRPDESGFGCIGPGCAKWRWVMQAFDSLNGATINDGVFEWPDRSSMTPRYIRDAPPEARGYCGLGGPA